MDYAIRPADNLRKLKQKLSQHKFSIDTLILEKDQVILLPKSITGGVTLIEYHTKGTETLNSILAEYGISKTDLMYFNSLDQLYFVAGQTLEIE